MDGGVDEMANIYPHFALAVSQPFLVLLHVAYPLSVCPLHAVQLSLDGSHGGNRTATGTALKDERSDDEGEGEDEDESSALKKKKDS